MSGITDDDVDAMIAVCVPCSSWRGGMRAAAEEIKRRVLERVKAESKPMHEPVSDDEAKAMIDAIHYGKADSFYERVRAAGNGLLAGRAAATRAEVVVTEEMVLECQHAINRAPMLTWDAKTVDGFCLHWLADRLNGKHAAPVDPRVEIVRDWAQSYSIEPDDKPIAELLAKLDARKP